MTQWLSEERGGVLIASLFLCAGFLSLLIVALCWPAYLIQHRQVRLAADHAGDAVTQKLGRLVAAWAPPPAAGGLTPREAGCTLLNIARAHTDELQAVALAYAQANGAAAIEGFTLAPQPDRLQIRFAVTKKVRLPVFADRFDGDRHQARADSLDDIVQVYAVPVDLSTPCP